MKSHKFDWFYGRNRTPDNLKDAAAIAWSCVAGAAAFITGFVLLAGAWLGGVI